MSLKSKILETLHRDQWMEAAILVPCFQKDKEPHVLLTRRTEEVLHHKGQICFPGGARDAADKNLWETALRETQEEVGLAPDKVTFIRELKQQITPTGFQVTPFVASIEIPEAWTPNPNEIAEIFSIPISHLREPKNVRIIKKTYNDIEFLEPHFTYLSYDVWGMTGRVMCELLEYPISL